MLSLRASSSPAAFFRSAELADSPRGRLLLISYHFPPGNGAGALRWQKLARFVVDAGWSLRVVTGDPATLVRPDFSRLQDLPPGVRVYGARAVTPALVRIENLVWPRLRRLLRWDGRSTTRSSGGGSNLPRPDSLSHEEMLRGVRSGRDLIRAYHALHEHLCERRWAFEAAARGTELLRRERFAAILTCGPPHMAHEAGRRLARTWSLPLIADLRDPWSLVQRLPETIASPVTLRLARHYERKLLRDAACVIANTVPAQRKLQAAYPAAATRVEVVMNGYDDEEIPRREKGSRFLVAYAGTIYLDRDPRPLFRAAAGLTRAFELTPKDFGIEFMGHVRCFGGESIQEIAAEEGLAGFVRVHPPASRREALEFLARAALLVSLPQDSSAAIPSKVFEYMQFDAWLLAIAEEGSATDLALRGTNASVVAPHDLTTLSTVLRERYEQFRAGFRPRAAEPDGPLSRRAQAAKLLDAIERVTGAAECLPTGGAARLANHVQVPG
jgi:hypothetical protein